MALHSALGAAVTVQLAPKSLDFQIRTTNPETSTAKRYCHAKPRALKACRGEIQVNHNATLLLAHKVTQKAIVAVWRPPLLTSQFALDAMACQLELEGEPEAAVQLVPELVDL